MLSLGGSDVDITRIRPQTASSTLSIERRVRAKTRPKSSFSRLSTSSNLTTNEILDNNDNEEDKDIIIHVYDEARNGSF